jgi:phenylpropionate dioxygenase-like ring-hydroxylating dioxygenase large terminal subunit
MSAEVRTAARFAELVADAQAAIDAGRTLPAYWYTDPVVWEAERDAVFRRTWQIVGPFAETLAKPGDFATVTVAGVPVAIVRDKEGELRAFVNVCRHRGHEVVSGCGHAMVLQCRYHGWTYGLDGELRAAPRSDREDDFDLTKWPLLDVQLAQWGPFVFVNLDPAAPSFEDTFADAMATADEYGMGLGDTSYRDKVQWDWDCNWKVLMDNGADCYHCPLVHRSFSKTHGVDADSYSIEINGQWDFHHSPGKTEGATDYRLLAAFPAWKISATPNDIRRIRMIEPVSATETRVTTFFAFPKEIQDPTVIRNRLKEQIAYNDLIVNQEDREVCESVQRGLESNTVITGPLLLDSEYAIPAFQSRMRDWFASAGERATVPA